MTTSSVFSNIVLFFGILVNSYVIDDIVWKDAYELTIGGLAFPKSDLESPYDRLPASAKGHVSDGVWNQSIASAGVHVEFKTDASEIWVNYSIQNTFTDLWNLEEAACSGVDIFAFDIDNNIYRWVGTFEDPSTPLNLGLLVDGLDFEASTTQYRINFPLWSRVLSFAVGVPNVSAYFDKLGLARVPAPIIWYGTSIAQGKSSAMPSSAYLVQLNLALWPKYDILNFGFSSNGKMESSVMDFLNTIRPVKAFVIDCLPNMGASDVTNRTIPLVNSIRDTHAYTVPVVLVESATYGEEWYNKATAKSNADKRAALQSSYDQLIASGTTNLLYVTGNQLLGDMITTNTFQVDGTHPNDLGMNRMFSWWVSYIPTTLK